MKSHEVLREVIETKNIKELADSLGVSLSTLYKWTEAPNGGSGIPNPLDRIAELIRITSDPKITNWICAQSDGFFISNPSSANKLPESAHIAANKLVCEFAEMISTIATAAGDNRINAQESEALRDKWEALKSLSEGFVRNCEEGNFDKLQAGLKAAASQIR